MAIQVNVYKGLDCIFLLDQCAGMDVGWVGIDDGVVAAFSAAANFAASSAWSAWIFLRSSGYCHKQVSVSPVDGCILDELTHRSPTSG